jgi:hypothetical protein
LGFVVALVVATLGGSSHVRTGTIRTRVVSRELDPRLAEAARLDAELSANGVKVRRVVKCLEDRRGDCGSLRRLSREALALKARLDGVCYRLVRKYGTMYTGPCAY